LDSYGLADIRQLHLVLVRLATSVELNDHTLARTGRVAVRLHALAAPWCDPHWPWPPNPDGAFTQEQNDEQRYQGVYADLATLIPTFVIMLSLGSFVYLCGPLPGCAAADRRYWADRLRREGTR
jgi:hypothetical protein